MSIRASGSESAHGDVTAGNYGSLLGEIKARIRSAQYRALRAVNRELIGLYWDIGRIIVERQKQEQWGRGVVERLAADLRAEFPGIRGFSASNLWRMRVFYETYAGDEKLASLTREIGWTHNYIILEKCKDEPQRVFYLRMVQRMGWTVSALARHIHNRAYEKTLINQVNFDKTLPDEVYGEAKLAVRDEYSFDFLEMGDEFSERQLQTRILARIEPFLSEMGGAFAFISSQFRLQVGDKEFFIDLLLYHRHLRCLVAVELKAGEFLPEYVGKVQFYLTALDDRVRTPMEQPSIGIILCRSRDRTVVEYALRDAGKPIGVAAYRMVAELPEELRGQLPDPSQLALLMKEV